MNMKHDFPQMADGNVVYVRRVAMDSLPDEVREQAPGVVLRGADERAQRAAIATAAT